MLLILQLIFLILAIMYGFTCVARLIHKQAITMGQTFLMAVGIAGFIVIRLYI